MTGAIEGLASMHELAMLGVRVAGALVIVGVAVSVALRVMRGGW